MMKRKRLFERGDSYCDTGIPCGNPKRVQTGEVLCMPSDSAPAAQEEDMETQGEKQLRVMAQKQLKTDVTLTEVLSQQRHFTEAGRYKPVTKEIRGMMGLQEYQDVAKGDQRVEELRQCGLNDDEIRLQLCKEGMAKGLDSCVTHKSTFGANPDIKKEQLNAIETKMKEKESSLAAPDSVRGLKEVSRQEMDIEKSMFRGTDRDRNDLSNLLTRKKSSVTGDPNDPINHLPQIMAEIEERSRKKIREKRRRRRRNRRRCIDGDELGNNAHDIDNEHEEDAKADGVTIGCLTLEEMTALRPSEKPTQNSEEETDAICSSDTHLNASSCSSVGHADADCERNSEDTSNTKLGSTNDATELEPGSESSRKILRGPIEFLPVDYIKENRLGVEEIKNLPRFTNYEAGNPSNVLYVKNLAPRVSERDLVSIFGQFQNKATGSEVVYKLMTGRMRGQAFVTFCNADVASQALLLVNGFILHGKPMIVQYGKRTAA